MAASKELLEVKKMKFELLSLSYFTFNFDRICGRLHGLIRACISDSLVSMLLFPLMKFHFQIAFVFTGSFMAPNTTTAPMATAAAGTCTRNILYQ